MRIIGICGLGGSGKEILDLVERKNLIENNWDKIVFIDKFVSQESYRGYEVYVFEDINDKFKNDKVEFIISVGDIYLRQKIFKQINDAGYRVTTIIAPGVHIPKSTQIGEGVIIRDNSFISVDVVIGNNVIVQPNAVIGHDVSVGCNSIVSSQAVIAGGVNIGENTYIALGCAVKELINIGSDNIISMGTVVNKDIGSNYIVRGNPAEIVSKNYLKSAFKLNTRKI